MGDDATPEETSGITPTPADTGAEGVVTGAGSASGSDVTQEIPVVRDDAAVEEPETAAAEEQQPDAEPEPEASSEPDAEPEPEASSEPDAETDTEPEPTSVETGPETVAADESQASAEPAVEATTAAEAATTEAVPPAAVTTDGPAHAAPGRSVARTVLAVVASVAILAGAALAGFAYGRSSAPGPDIVVQGEPVVEESADVEPMPTGAMPSTIAPILSVRQQALGAPTAVLTAAVGLDDTAGAASGYHLVNSGISGGQIAAVLGSTFGVRGSAVQQADSWTVGREGAATVVVNDDALFSWTFRDPERLSAPVPGQQLEPADAIDLANTLLSGIGVDTTAVDWQVDRYFDRTAVTAWQLIADQRTQLRWLIAFDPEGSVVEAAGFSAALEPAGTYDVVGAASAVARSNTPPWWTLGATLVEASPDGQAQAPLVETSDEPTVSPESPVASEQAPSASAEVTPSDAAESADPTFGPESSAAVASETPDLGVASEEASDSSTEPATGLPGLVVRVDDVVVTEATLGLAQYWQPDGSVLMLPSYTLVGLDGSRWSLLAVTDEYVDFVPSTDPIADASDS